MIYDVIVIGGGPAGMLAAIGAVKNKCKVIIIEKTQNLGQKMLISGGGRCNLTNISDIDELIKNIPGNGKFLFSALNQFSNIDTINFFEKELKIKTKVEEHGKVFPVTNQAKTIIAALKKYLLDMGVQIIYGDGAREIITEENKVRGVILISNKKITAKSVVIATGGVSFPKTGSTGEGYKMANKLGHSITDLFPASVPLTSDDLMIKEKMLQGISLRNIRISLYDINDKHVKTEEGDLIFTHFGISGPAVLRLSRYVSLLQKKIGKETLKVIIDIMPEKNESEIRDLLNNFISNNENKLVINGLSGFLPEKILNVIVTAKMGIGSKKMNEINQQEMKILVSLVKNFVLFINGPKPIEYAIVTGGGINLKEVNPKTLGSKIIEGLFMAGEVLDIDGFTGGYNMQTAFSTGYTAGRSASLYSQNR